MKNKIVYLYEAILVVFVVVLKLVFIDKLANYTDIVNSIFWIISLFVLSRIIGVKKDNNICKENSVQIAIITILGYFLVTYLSGLFLGFLKNSYSLKPISMLKNIYPVIIMVICQELIRSMIARKSGRSNRPIVFLTIIYIVLDFLLVFNLDNLNSGLKVFVFVTSTLLPNIARHILCSYVCKKVSPVPGLIVRLFFGIYAYVLPIYPDLGSYLTSLFGVLLPYIIYVSISKLVQKTDKDEIRKIKKSLWYVNIPLIVFLVICVLLISGLFKYQIMAIGSGSMEPVYYRGDAILFEKLSRNELDEITEGVILVFEHNNTYVTHRVVEIKEENKKRIYQTKGDNNKDNDKFLVYEEDVVGIVKLRLKYVGLPTIWFQNLIG